MFGDFSRDSYAPGKQYTRVLMQQGRPLIDADWNEQITSLIEAQRQLAIALIGWHGTPDEGFKLVQPADKDDCTLSVGTYFVDGIQCRNEAVKVEAPNRPLTLPPFSDITGVRCVYLDVWEQSICPSQDKTIVEPALGRIDTAWRSQVQWTVRYSDAVIDASDYKKFIAAVQGRAENDVTLAVQQTSSAGVSTKGACENDSVASSQADRLYRVEIHKKGKAAATEDIGNNIDEFATFKWSRENGSAVASVVSSRDTEEKVLPPGGATLIRDGSRFSSSIPLEQRRWCELIDREGRSANEQRRLVQIEGLEGDRIQVSPRINVAYDPVRAMVAPFDLKASTEYFLRQWDHAGTELTNNEDVKLRFSDVPPADGQPPSQILKKPILSNGCLVVVAGCWIQLENGISVKFDGTNFLEGDYWLIRVSRNNDVTLLPGPNPQAPAAARTIHHYAPIGTITQNSGNSNKKLLLNSDSYRKPITKSGAEYKTGDHPFGLPSPGLSVSAAAQTSPPSLPIPVPSAPGPLINPVSVLSGEGKRALTGYFESSQSLTRRVPARYLNHESSSTIYSHFRSALLVSEILEESFEKYFAKVDRCLSLKESDRAIVEKDARADYALAVEFERMLLSGETSRPRIA